jgi:hypothetical protein
LHRLCRHRGAPPAHRLSRPRHDHRLDPDIPAERSRLFLRADPRYRGSPGRSTECLLHRGTSPRCPIGCVSPRPCSPGPWLWPWCCSWPPAWSACRARFIPLYLIFLVRLLGGPRLLYRWAKDSYAASPALPRSTASRDRRCASDRRIRPRGDWGWTVRSRTPSGCPHTWCTLLRCRNPAGPRRTGVEQMPELEQNALGLPTIRR